MRSPSFDEFLSDRLDGAVSSVSRMQLSDHCLDMLPSCDIGNMEFLPDFMIGHAVADQLENIKLSLGQEIAFFEMAGIENVMDQWIDVIDSHLH